MQVQEPSSQAPSSLQGTRSFSNGKEATAAAAIFRQVGTKLLAMPTWRPVVLLAAPAEAWHVLLGSSLVPIMGAALTQQGPARVVANCYAGRQLSAGLRLWQACWLSETACHCYGCS